MIRVGTLTELPSHLAIHGVNEVWVDAIPDLIIGDLKSFADAASVTSVPIPGYWTHKAGSKIKVAAPPALGERVIYYLHAGSYMRLSAHPSDMTAKTPSSLLKYTTSMCRIFAIEYRLSSTKPFAVANPFPAALIDAVAGFNYLVNVIGFSPLDIVVLGDSSGGNLAHALTRCLVENHNSPLAKLPAPPGGLIMNSPWCDLSDSHDTPGSSVYTNASSDYLDFSAEDGYPKKAFLGPHGFEASESNRYISPACRYSSLTVDFKGFPRTFIVAGGAELLLDQIRTLRKRMVHDLGEGDGVNSDEGKVRYLEEPDSVHVFHSFEWHEPERSRSLREMAKWIAAAD